MSLPRAVTDSEEYAQLSAQAVKLFIDLGAQFRGNMKWEGPD